MPSPTPSRWCANHCAPTPCDWSTRRTAACAEACSAACSADPLEPRRSGHGGGVVRCPRGRSHRPEQRSHRPGQRPHRPEQSVENRGGCVPCARVVRSEEHTSELQSRGQLVCRLLLEKKKQFVP